MQHYDFVLIGGSKTSFGSFAVKEQKDWIEIESQFHLMISLSCFLQAQTALQTQSQTQINSAHYFLYYSIFAHESATATANAASAATATAMAASANATTSAAMATSATSKTATAIATTSITTA